MRAYELMVIIDTDTDDAAIGGIVERIGGLVTEAGGRVATTDHWGRRPFAYRIGKRTEGYYLVLELVAPGGLDELDRFLRLADEVVRHKMIRLPDKEAAKRGLLGEASPA